MGLLRVRRVLGGVAAAYAVAAIVLVLAPWGWELNRLTVALYTTLRFDVPIAPAWVRPEHVGMLLNVLLFVPAGALLVALARLRWWQAVAVAALASASVETVQSQWLDRVGEWNDLLANTLGAAIGALAVTLLSRRRSPRAGPPVSRRPH